MDYIIGLLIGVISSIAGAIILNLINSKLQLNISFRRIFKSIVILYEKIKADGHTPDYIMGIDRNGCIIASILSGFFGFHTILTARTIAIRNTDGSSDRTLSTNHLYPENILSGKKVLIVACFVDTGSAFEAVYNHYKSLNNGPSEIITATLYTTSSPRYKPNYFVFEIGKDIKVTIGQIMHRMPWMTKDWNHVLADERLC